MSFTTWAHSRPWYLPFRQPRPPAHALVTPNPSEPKLCLVCKSLLVRPDKPIPGTQSPLADHVQYSDVNRSAVAGCPLCLLIVRSLCRDIPHEKLRHLVATLGQHFSDGCKKLYIHVWCTTDDPGPQRRWVIHLHQRSTTTPIEQPKIAIDPARDPQGRNELPVALVASMTTSTTTQDDKCMSTIRNWIKSCVNDHPLCQPRNAAIEQSQLPTRLIDINNLAGPKIISTLSLHADLKSLRYVTLSHRWGTQTHARLLQANLERMYHKLDMAELSPVFKDTFTVARTLDIQYVWIDCLCIIQDSKEDWEREASRMGMVYQNAYCNFGATAASYDSEYGSLQEPDLSRVKPGLFTRRDPFNIFPTALHVKRQGCPYTEYVGYTGDMVGYIDKVRELSLLRRGWVLQERMLSPRSVYFGVQLSWECAEYVASEAFPGGLPVQKLMNHVHRGTPRRLHTMFWGYHGDTEMDRSEHLSRIYRNWLFLVQDYSHYKLTYDTDILPAMSGLTKAFAQVLGDDFIAGIWRKDLVRGILWRTWYNPKLHLAPTWSWASSIDVEFASLQAHDDEFAMKVICQVEEAKAFQSSTDPMGAISGGRLTLTGPCKQSVPRTHNSDYVDLGLFNCGGFADWYDTAQMREDPDKRGKTVHFVVACHEDKRDVLGLILQATPVADQYRRVGMFIHPYRWVNGFHHNSRSRSLPRVIQEQFPEFADFDPEGYEPQTVTII